MRMNSVIQFVEVTKEYGEKTAVDNLTLEVERGQVVAFLGPNGAGKTTSMSMMLGLMRPTKGAVRLLGKDPTRPENRTDVGAMLQEVSLPEKLKAVEVVDLFRSYYPSPLSTQQLLALAGLTDVATAQASKLSGGQQRRLQFALAMAGNPKVLFLDEPTTGMDVASRRAFWQELRRYVAEESRTILFSTHHLEEVEGTADRVIVIQRGRVVADGSPNELKEMVGYKYISFTATGTISGSELNQLPGVDSVEQTGRHVRIRTRQSDEVLRALFVQNFPISQVNISSGGFEDAFVSITEA